MNPRPPKKEDPKPAGSGASGSASSERPLKKEDPKPSGSGTNSTSSASSAPGAGASGSSTGHPHLRELYDTSSRQMHTQMERLSKIYRNVQLSYTFLTIGGGALALGIGYVIINWTMLRSQAAQESAEVVSQTMQNAQVQFSAREFSKELLNQLFNDDEIATTVASWTLRLLTSIQQEIGALFVHILQQQQVVDEVNRLADKLVAYLCESQTIQASHVGATVDDQCKRLLTEVGQNSELTIPVHCRSSLEFCKPFAGPGPSASRNGPKAFPRIRRRPSRFGAVSETPTACPARVHCARVCKVRAPMSDLMGRPLLPEPAGSGGSGWPQRPAKVAEVFAVALLLASTAQLLAFSTGLQGVPLLKEDAPKGGGSLKDLLLHWLDAYYVALLPAAPYLTYLGTFLFVFIFLMSAVNKVKNFSGTVKMVEGMGVPCPTVSTIACILDIFLGSILYLTGVPVLMEWGAEFLLIFLLLASYYGHFKPWMQTKEEFHTEMLLKNLALMGQCFLTIGFEVPEIGKDGTPLGLNGALGEFGEVCGKIYGVLKPYSYIFKYCGILMFVLIFLFAGMKHLIDFKGTVEMNKHLGIPLPTISALMAVLLLLSGSFLYLTGRPVFMEAGAEVILLFLIISTIPGHLKPLRETGDFKQMLHLLKNISMAGGCLMTIGAVLPQIVS
ncbi:unnamed protein product [Durusdinium trenchii]|uniref:Uncharacterized protein n=1 Tax=Durusdinium trenchii TaxID=1381693 RepID=A0ABP0JS32_9DINO